MSNEAIQILYLLPAVHFFFFSFCPVHKRGRHVMIGCAHFVISVAKRYQASALQLCLGQAILVPAGSKAGLSSRAESLAKKSGIDS